MPTTEVAVLLDNVRSLANVGAIFRSADGVGARHVYLAGISPTPEHPRLAKTALGAEATVPWSHDPDPLSAARRAVDDGFDLWILEGDGEDLFSPAAANRRPVCLVAGHERAGVDPRMRAHATRVVRIPMCGAKTSLNVATAVTVALYGVRFGLRSAADGP
ncbi:MAG: TrmH family RNA methyltransferase [Deltaproteobacteria bacterium]|nr:MAG: TrmH family RNA methyltransferase [Deltaproteobacteria bacterium]